MLTHLYLAVGLTVLAFVLIGRALGLVQSLRAFGVAA
jgi:hypothetical protein